VTQRWPDGRIFLFAKPRIHFIGMVEAVPVPEGQFLPLRLVLRHEPHRKSYGIRNIVFRKQAYHWRRVIAQSLMKPPTELSCWRWTSPQWPSAWESLRTRPLWHGVTSIFWFPLCQLKSMLRAGELPRLSACLNPGLHHFLLGLRVYLEKIRRQKRKS
jgi:hypothetical protein